MGTELRKPPTSSSQPLHARQTSRALEVASWLMAPLLTLVAYRHAASVDFVGDARMLILDNRWLESLDHLGDNLTHNYFWSSAGHLVPYWRPVTKGAWWLEKQLFGTWAGGFALVQLGWHLLAVVGTQRLAAAWGVSRWMAVAAACVVGLHPVAIAPVSMIMARSDVVALAAAVWCVLGWWNWRRAPDRYRWAAVHVAGLILGLGSKETAIVLPALLTSFAVLDGDLAPPRRRQLWRLMPAWVAASIYLLLRTWLLGREAPGLSSVSLGVDPLRVGACLAQYLENLWPIASSSSVRDIPQLEAQSAELWLQGAPTLLAAAVILAFAVRRREHVLLFGFVWIAAALAPVLLTAKIHVPAVEDKFPLADRWLYHALPAAAIAWARLFDLLRPRWLGRGFQLAVTGWATLMLLRSGPARAEFATELGMLDNEDRAYYYATPPRFRTAQDHCRFHERRLERGLRHGDDARVVAAFADLQVHCSHIEYGRWVQLVEALVRLERFDEAEPVVRRLIRTPPAGRREARRLARLAGTVLLGRRDFAAASAWLTRAWKLGARDCRLLVLAAEAARGSGDPIAAGHRLEEAFVCGGRRDPSLLLAAATWALDAGDEGRARSLLDRLGAQPRLSPNQRGQLRYLRRRLDGPHDALAPSGVPVLRRP